MCFLTVGLATKATLWPGFSVRSPLLLVTHSSESVPAPASPVIDDQTQRGTSDSVRSQTPPIVLCEFISTADVNRPENLSTSAPNENMNFLEVDKGHIDLDITPSTNRPTVSRRTLSTSLRIKQEKKLRSKIASIKTLLPSFEHSFALDVRVVDRFTGGELSRDLVKQLHALGVCGSVITESSELPNQAVGDCGYVAFDFLKRLIKGEVNGDLWNQVEARVSRESFVQMNMLLGKKPGDWLDTMDFVRLFQHFVITANQIHIGSYDEFLLCFCNHALEKLRGNKNKNASKRPKLTSNQPPFQPEGKHFWIVNTHPSWEKGVHWVAVVYI
eukprot:c11008_g1_i2.p1 GENE.c11008_g1_i2~~c11008_g1_i2.p1  ORF type:complete len:329 (-),score=24.46 c11008_g1_i2:34-1020(-)